MQRTALVAGALLAMQAACAQNMITGEYWVDVDPGFGAATPFNPDLSGTTDDEAGLVFNIPTATLSVGMHTVGYRTMDDNATWSLTNLRPLYITAPPANATIVRTEYFLNTDPGWGGGSDADVDGSDDVTAATTANLSNAVVGMNTLFYRSLDADGHWSLTNHRPLYVADSSSGVIVTAESFWDVDPGFGEGDSLQNWTPGEDVVGIFNAVVPGIADLPNGNHLLYIRSKDSRGRWSLTNFHMDSVNVDFSNDVASLEITAGIRVYPNPFAETITVSATDAKPLRFILYDPQGKLVLDQVFTQQQIFDLKTHAAGMYQAYFWQEAKRIHAVNLVKQ